jgi:hypothetical protein
LQKFAVKKDMLLKARGYLLSIRLKLILYLLFIVLLPYAAGAHTLAKDTMKYQPTTFSGSIGLSSNGFSIVPTFSLNSPATMTLLSWRKNKFSFDPDIRLTPDVKKGSMIFWLRYHAITKAKYSLRIGAHPAMNFQTRDIPVNGGTSTLSQMRRFFAWEVSNDFKISKHVGIGVYYLQGNGLQKDGARTTHFVSFNTVVAGIKLGQKLRVAIAPSVYYLYLDGAHGEYVSGTVTLSHPKFPFTLQHAFNKTLSSNIAGNQDYMWNFSVHYHFKKTYRRV